MTRATNAKRFSQVMRDMARVPSQVSTAVARDISREIQRSMSAGKDPYGRPWKKKRNGGTSTLKKSGRGRASIVVSALAGAGFRITVAVLYMIYHQFGGKSHLRGHKKNKNFGRDKDRSGGRNHPPKRSFIPFDRVPSTWRSIVAKHIERAGQRLIKRG